MKNSPGAKALPCLQSSALSSAARSAISICHNKPPLSQAGNYRFRSRTAPGSISCRELRSPDTRAPARGAQRWLSLAFIACGSRDSLGIHSGGDFICQLHSHIFTTWITELHRSQAALCALQRSGINIWLCIQQKGAQMVWGATAEVFIKLQVRALLDSENLSRGLCLTGVVMNNKRTIPSPHKAPVNSSVH